MTLLNLDFTPAPLYETEFDVPVPAAELDPPFDTFGADVEDDERASRSPGERALSMVRNKERFRESAAQRTGALVWASLEEAAATDRQTSAIDRQTAVMEAQLAIAQQQLTQSIIANQLAFFALDPSDFVSRRGPEQVSGTDGSPVDSIYTQMKRNIGILPPIAATADPTPASVGAEPHADADTEEFGG